MSDQRYDHQQIEDKWLKFWEAERLFCGTSLALDAASAADKEYLLYAFAYPSGSGLHVGHVEPNTALDIQARYKRMIGKQVFFPVGWDAFGLPAENYAIKTGIHPRQTTSEAIKTFRGQVKRLGISYDWDTEIATNHPEYYKFTQWIFLRLFEQGLAYQGEGKVNWCPSCQTVLANEQVVEGACERCDSQVVQKELKQWYFKITDYRDELIAGLEQVDWPTPTKQQQINWIGRAEGLSIDFSLVGTGQALTVWTKFWETVFGTTFLVIAPEKFLELGLLEQVVADRRQAVQDYLDAANKKTEEERKIGEKDKTGVDTGLLVTNPVNGEQVPLFVADYVLLGVGTAIVMGVPAHDERDFAFAKKFGLEIKQVVSYADPELDRRVREGEQAHEGEGKLVNSGAFDGQAAWGAGKQQMAAWMSEQGFARFQTTYRLRDWLISRQRYWGAPIPIVYDPQGQAHPVKEEHLPWLLPDDVDFKPTGESPLRSSVEFKARVERLYGKGWTPEYDTMDTFVDSSWYYLRYCSARDEAQFADKAALKQWLPVDLYLIGPEHIVLHLLYSRFFTKFLRDQGYLELETGEPFAKMRHQGMILGPDGRKMSKSKGNVINPDDIIKEYGADTLRVYEMFMGPLEADKPWNPRAVAGVARFLRKMHRLVRREVTRQLADSGAAEASERATLRAKLHWTIRKLSTDIPELKYNTAIAALMELSNLWEKLDQADQVLFTVEELLAAIKLLAPFAPFLAEELYEQSRGLSALGDSNVAWCQSVHLESWPQFEPSLLVEEQVQLVVQVNGKVRAQFAWPSAELTDEAAIVTAAQALPELVKWLDGQALRKAIYVPGKLVNLVVG